MSTPNLDRLAERIRERLTESDESDLDTLCGKCGATVTSTDHQAGACTQCGAEIDDDVDDESADEDLWDIADYENMRRDDGDY